MKAAEAAKAAAERSYIERAAKLRREGVQPKALLEEAAREGHDVARIKREAAALAAKPVPPVEPKAVGKPPTRPRPRPKSKEPKAVGKPPTTPKPSKDPKGEIE